MPGLDKTGPKGRGSKTGRGMGNCGSDSSSVDNKTEQINQDSEMNIPRRIRNGGRGAGQGKRYRHRGGQEN